MRELVQEIYLKHRGDESYFKKLGWNARPFYDLRKGAGVSMFFVLDVLYLEGEIREIRLSEIVRNLMNSIGAEDLTEFSIKIDVSYRSIGNIMFGKYSCGAGVFERICENAGYKSVDVLKKGGKMW